MKREELEKICKDIRKDILFMISNASSGHPGGSLSAVEILVTLYFEIMNLNEKDGKRIDKFILSKGHAAPLYYAVLAKKGFIKKEELSKLRKIDSKLEGHPTNKINGVDVSSGSLGQGLSIANGMALSKKLFNEKGYVYCLCGDGEMEEGQVWEAMMSASKYKLNNLILIIDNNGLQIDGTVESVKNLIDLEKKCESFGFYTKRIDGHNIDEIINSINLAKKQERPICILASTIKGKGVSFMENQVKWHGKAPSKEEVKEAILEIEKM